MKKKTLITLRIIITLLLISPILAFAGEAFYPRPKIAPPPEMVGGWETEVETCVGKLQISFNLYEDGTVEGTVNDATMEDAYFKRNRGWLCRILDWSTEYIIVGGLSGSVASEVQCAEFYIEGCKIKEEGMKGDIDVRKCWKDGKKYGPFGAGPLIYTRVEQPQY